MSGPTPAQLSAHGIQTLIELSYVKTANDGVEIQMSKLEQALQTTNNVLLTLTDTQNLHNAVSTASKSAFVFDYKSSYGGVNNYAKAYNAAASAYYGTPINPTFNYASAGASGFASYMSSFLTTKSSIKGEITSLSSLSTPSALTDPNSLYTRLKTVYSQMPSTVTYSSLKEWALDNFDQHSNANAGNAGKIQQAITTAVTAAQSLNQTQTTKVQSYLFLFEEYYKSAATILSQLEQLLIKMADGIYR